VSFVASVIKRESRDAKRNMKGKNNYTKKMTKSQMENHGTALDVTNVANPPYLVVIEHVNFVVPLIRNLYADEVNNERDHLRNYQKKRS
jgi:hypothetical protein